MFKWFALPLAALACSVPALADSFMPPTIREVRSPSESAVVTVIPAKLSCAVGEENCEPAARAVVELVRGYERFASRTVRLVNREAPGTVLVTDDGERLLTIDDYAWSGFGENVLVVYDDNGAVTARHALNDFLPGDYINGLPRSVSTLRWWSAEPRIEPGTHTAILSLLLVEKDGWQGRGDALELTLDLDTGEIERPSGARFEMALNCARANAWLVPDNAAERERERYRKLCG